MLPLISEDNNRADTRPVVLHYKTDILNSTAFLFSLKATSKQLAYCLSELSGYSLEDIKIKYADISGITNYLNLDDNPLSIKGINKNTTFIIESIPTTFSHMEITKDPINTVQGNKSKKELEEDKQEFDEPMDNYEGRICLK